MQSRKSHSDKYKDPNFENSETTFSDKECLKDEQDMSTTEQKSVYENLRVGQPIKDEGNGYETLQTMTRQETKTNHKICANRGCTKETSVVIFLLTVCASVGVAALVIALSAENKPATEAVDGSWSAWALWEACSSTCDVGMQIRRRNCSNPAPIGSGRQCLGVDNEQRLCMPGPCLTTHAFDGSWSVWALWEACSSTCDVGMQIRRRNCSDPAPIGSGRQCLGVDNEQRLCMPGPCLTTKAVDGSWSAWALWEACSSTCDVGMQIRRRNCSNPAPIGSGRHCLGVDNEQRLCMPGPCLNGGWSEWGSWGACSASCNGGIRSRSRNCSNPFPSLAGRYCDGNPMETISCDNIPCKADVIAFHASKAADLSLSRNQIVVFQEIIMNEGRSYNSATGVFTAPLSGIYQFSVHLCAQQTKNLDYALMHGNRFILRGFYSESDKSGTCTSFSVPVIVNHNEQVRVVYDGSTSTSDILFQDDDDWNAFSGVLIHELN